MTRNLRIFVLRHAERADSIPEDQRPEYSVSFDPPLTDTGKLQAEVAVKYILTQIPEGASVHLVSSPFLRCIQTSMPLAQALNIPVIVDEVFGEYITNSEFECDPFDDLTYKTDTNFSQILKGVRLLESRHVLRPMYPENFTRAEARTKMGLDYYVPRVRQDVLVIVSHLFIVDTLTVLMGGKSMGDSHHFTLLSEARHEDGVFTVLKNGNIEHLRTVPEIFPKAI
jgi:broad specificity phosphatase PhoE